MAEKFDPALLRQLLELASTEQDPAKLMTLIEQINVLFEAKAAAKAQGANASSGRKLA